MQTARLVGTVVGALIGLRGGSLWNVFFYAWLGAWIGGILGSRYAPRTRKAPATPRPRRPSARERALGTLGLPPAATLAQARTAYRNLARKYHPDTLRARGANAAELERATKTMARLNAAWNYLSKTSSAAD